MMLDERSASFLFPVMIKYLNSSLGLLLIFMLLSTSCATKRMAREVTGLPLEEVEEQFLPSCDFPLTEISLSKAEQYLKKESLPLKRMDLAKELVRTECLNVYQLIRISRLFNQEQEVLDFALYAHSFCYNPSMYFLFEKELILKSNKQILREFLN